MSTRNLQRPPRKLTTEQPVESSPTWHATCGIAFLVVSLFYLLALLSYDPADLPAWCNLAMSDTPTPLARNLIGRLGAVIAGYTFWMFGAANYIIPICFIWFAANKLATQARLRFRAWIGFALMVSSGAAILYLQTIWEWEDKNVTPFGAGGGLGYVVGHVLLLGILGEAGSLLILGFTYLIGMIFVTGLHPVQVFMQVLKSIREGLKNWWINRKQRRLEAEVAAQQAFIVPPPSEPLPRSRRRRPAEELDVPSPETSPMQLELPSDLPLPKIFDASAPKPAIAKPALSEVWQKRREQKEERALFALPKSLTAKYKNYKVPPLDILNWPDISLNPPADEGALREMQNTIIRTLGTFDIKVTAGDITKGPAITRYEVYPSDGLRVSRIVNLEPDLARATKAERINILAPIPGRDTVGIELPNKDKIVVPIRELLEDESFQNGKAKIPLALGKDVYGKAIIADLASMPHLLVAGATGSGKSVCINSIITSLLCRFAPDELRFIMIDPKVVEMQGYKDLPHLALPVVTDPKLSLLALRWVVNEMEKRYQIFAKEGCRNFDSFNSRSTRKQPARSVSRAETSPSDAELALQAELNPETSTPQPSARRSFSSKSSSKLPHPDRYESDNVLDELDEEDGYIPNGSIWDGNSEPPVRKEPELEIPDSLPYIVVIVDELADLMQTAPADIEVAIARIAQKARAAGIHLILATQTPRADVVTGIIKANIPCRIAFQVSSALDSRVIMDRKGADKLVGKGDMLYLPPGTSQLIRAQGTMVTDDEITELVEFACHQAQPMFETVLNEGFDDGEGGGENAAVSPEDEAILEKVLDVISTEKKASTSLIQRRLRLGYTRAARMMDILEDRGIIGPGDGAKPREILVEL